LSTRESPQFDFIPPESTPPENQVPLPPAAPRSDENPVWGGWEILGIMLVTIASVFFFVILVTIGARRYIYPHEQLMEVAQGHPVLLLIAQGLAYLVVIAFMVLLVKRVRDRTFAGAIRWNWPMNPWAFLLGGVGLSVALQILGHFLPIPKELPMDRFFKTPIEAWGVAIFGILVAPLMEELFFRGFLYPVLARWLGVSVSVVLTGIGFGLLHASQLGRAWAPVFMIFLVGVVLTTVRAVTKSVASSWLVHFAYNGTIFTLMFIATSGFRHMEKLNAFFAI
jgi:membrane protease YdiL (CAAX protease family)